MQDSNPSCQGMVGEHYLIYVRLLGEVIQSFGVRYQQYSDDPQPCPRMTPELDNGLGVVEQAEITS